MNVFGAHLSEKEREKVVRAIAASKKTGCERIDGEYRKTAEENLWLRKIVDYMNEELGALGVRRRSVLSKEMVHFLPIEIFSEGLDENNEATTGEYFFGVICVQKELIEKTMASPKLTLIQTVLHEGLHSEQIHKAFAFKKKDSQLLSKLYRTGYLNRSLEENEPGQHEHFRGFNEAITQWLAAKIIKKHAVELAKIIKLENSAKLNEFLQEAESVFADEIAVVDKIVGTLARKNKETKKDVWQRFAKGSFTGKMMQLREIERNFGAGSLRVLAAMLSGIKATLTNPRQDFNVNREILKYFSIDDQKAKDKIALEILNQRERFAYLQRKREAEKSKS